MVNMSPGYKSYKVPGCNGVIPGWLIKHRGEEIDRAVTAATNALVEADLLRNTTFPSENTNPTINSDKSFKILSIIPTEIPDIDNVSNICLDNQFEFSLIDERFINKDKLSYTDADLESVLRYKETSTTTLGTIVYEYKRDNPSRSTLWGSIKAARDILLNAVLSDDNLNTVLITHDKTAKWGKINSDYVADNAIKADHIENDAVTEGKIKNGSVTNDKLATGISTDKISVGAGTNSVTLSAKLQELSDGVSGFKSSLSVQSEPAAATGVVKGITYDSNGVFTATYGTVETADIKNANVTTAKIGSKAVTRAKIDDLAINSDKIDISAVTNAKIADNAVTANKIGDLAISKRHLSETLLTDLNNMFDNIILDCGSMEDLNLSEE